MSILNGATSASADGPSVGSGNSWASRGMLAIILLGTGWAGLSLGVVIGNQLLRISPQDPTSIVEPIRIGWGLRLHVSLGWFRTAVGIGGAGVLLKSALD